VALALVKGHEWGWTSPTELATFGVAFGALALDIAHARRHPAPVLDRALLSLRPVAIANLGTVLFASAFFAATLNNVLFLTGSWGWSVLHAGLAITPMPLISAVVARPAGKLADRFGAGAVIAPGAVVYLSGMLLLHHLAPLGPSFWSHWLPGGALVGIGVGMVFPTLGGAALQDVPVERFGIASALNSTARQLGAVLGVSMLVVVFSAAGPIPAVRAEHAWIFAAVVAGLCGVVSLALPRPVRAAAGSTARVRRAEGAAA
jgi:NTE family protein